MRRADKAILILAAAVGWSYYLQQWVWRSDCAVFSVVTGFIFGTDVDRMSWVHKWWRRQKKLTLQLGGWAPASAVGFVVSTEVEVGTYFLILFMILGHIFWTEAIWQARYKKLMNGWFTWWSARFTRPSGSLDLGLCVYHDNVENVFLLVNFRHDICYFRAWSIM